VLLLCDGEDITKTQKSQLETVAGSAKEST
jgi:hypothetical protein